MSESQEVDPLPSAAPLPRGTSKPTRTRQRAKLRRILLFTVVIPAVVLGILFWVGTRVLSPEQMKYRAQAYLSDRLATGFSLGEIQWSWPARIDVQDLVIYSPPGSRYQELVSLPDLSISFNPWLLLGGEAQLTRMEIRGSRLVLERDHLGNLTILDVLRDAVAPIQGPALPGEEAPATTTSMTPPELIISNLRVDTCPETVAHSPDGLQVTSLRLEVSPDDPDLWTLDGTAFDSSVQSIRLDGGGRLSLGDFELALDVEEIQLDQQLRDRIPPALRLVWDRYHPSGKASIHHELMFRDAQPIKNSSMISIHDGSIHLEESDLRIDQLSGQLQITPKVISFRDPLRGSVLGTQAFLRGAIELEALQPGGSELELHLDKLEFEPRIRDVLPPDLQRAWDGFSPSGEFGLRISGGGDTFPPQLTEVSLLLQGVDASSSMYPYPLRNLTGELRYLIDHIELDIAGGLEEEPIQVRGRFDAKSNGNRQIVIEGKSLLLDDRIRTALGDRFSSIYDTYSPSGRTDLRIEIEKVETDEVVDVRVILEPRGASISHRAFPYKIEDLSGIVTIEATQKRVLFQDLAGTHGISKLTLPAGIVEFAPGKTLQMEIPIECTNLVPDEDLLASLPPGVAQRLRSLDILQGGGSLDTVVELRVDQGAPLDIYVRARIQDPIRLRYHKLPYPLVFHEGQVVFSSLEGRIRLDELATDRSQSPIVTVTGEIGPDDGLDRGEGNNETTLLSMNFKVEKGVDDVGLSLTDPDLVSSLPDDLKNFFQVMKLTGNVSGAASVLYRHGIEEDGEPSDVVEYDVEGLLDNGGFDFAIRAEDLSARFELHGGISPGIGHSFSGQLSDGDFRFSRFRAGVPRARPLTFTYGSDHPRILLSDAEENQIPTSWLIDQLPEDRSKLFQAEIGPAQIYGGPLDGFFFVDLSPQGGRFAGESSVSDIDLAQGSELLFKKGGVTGVAAGSVRVQGQVGFPDSILGDGSFSIRNGNLAQVPIVAGVLLNPFEGLNRRNNRIKEADCSFSIHDQLFEFKGMGSIKLKSPSGKILGKGVVGFDKLLHLIMEPQTLGGAPLLSDIANRLLRFRIEGTLDEPEIRTSRKEEADTSSPDKS